MWWKDSALVQIAQGATLQVLYVSTVREPRAYDLYAWLADVGQQFGWRRVFDTTALPDAANGGGIGLVCADRAQEGKPGHISVVVPERGQHRAKRDVDGKRRTAAAEPGRRDQPSLWQRGQGLVEGHADVQGARFLHS